MDTLQIAAKDLQVARLLGAAAQSKVLKMMAPNSRTPVSGKVISPA
jgi:hypothetical protein